MNRRPGRAARRQPAFQLLVGGVAVVLAFVVFTVAASAASFTRGFADSVFVWPGNNAQTAQQWDANAEGAGARMIEVEVDWSTYEPHRPSAKDNTANPASVAYGDWSSLDQTVENLATDHLEPLFLITDAPAWAQASQGAKSGSQGYEPNDHALQQFTRALATRYDGSFPNPSSPGHALPRVRYYQAWAEANLTIKLAPQWTRTHGSWTNTGALLYRRLLNSIYAGVKAAKPSDTVIFTGLAPYGDPTGGQRTPPVTFLEDVLCLNANLVRQRCSDPVHFDVLAADPYDVGAPTTAAINKTDASAPDLGKLTRVLDAAVAAHTVYPDKRKPLWVTEFSYDSKPPNPHGEPLATQARWLEQSFYVFWKEGVNTVLWYLIRDQAGHDWGVSYYSGLYYYNGKRKPSYSAFRFPLVVAADGSHAQIWGVAPTSGAVDVQQSISGRWHTIHVFHTRAGAVFDALIAPPTDASATYRARMGALTSVNWSY